MAKHQNTDHSESSSYNDHIGPGMHQKKKKKNTYQKERKKNTGQHKKWRTSTPNIIAQRLITPKLRKHKSDPALSTTPDTTGADSGSAPPSTRRKNIDASCVYGRTTSKIGIGSSQPVDQH